MRGETMILVDTGAWLALMDCRDAYHQRCRDFFRNNREHLMTTWPVLVECVHLMFVEFLRQKAKRHPGREKDKEDISFAEWPLEVKGNLRRSEIYDHL